VPVNKIACYLNACDKIFPPGLDNPAFAIGDDGSLDPTMFVSHSVKKYHTVKKRETLASIASKYHCSSADIKRWNKMKGGKVYKGQKLMVYATVYQKADKTDAASAEIKTDDSLKAPAIADTPKKKEASPQGSAGKIIHYVVVPGDTLWNIAQRNGMTVEKLKELNGIRNANELKPGTKLKVVGS
jgi:membrane-bound lytic murein transglycosylase D